MPVPTCFLGPSKLCHIIQHASLTQRAYKMTGVSFLKYFLSAVRQFYLFFFIIFSANCTTPGRVSGFKPTCLINRKIKFAPICDGLVSFEMVING